jgi:hypothetical protein
MHPKYLPKHMQHTYLVIIQTPFFINSIVVITITSWLFGTTGYPALQGKNSGVAHTNDSKNDEHNIGDTLSSSLRDSPVMQHWL